MVDGVPHRWRRGVLVAIPEKWAGGQNVLHSQTQRKRPSKGTGKMKKFTKAQQGTRIPKDTLKKIMARKEPILRLRKYSEHRHTEKAPTVKEFDEDI